jgi:hypothetical protein
MARLFSCSISSALECNDSRIPVCRQGPRIGCSDTIYTRWSGRVVERSLGKWWALVRKQTFLSETEATRRGKQVSSHTILN